MSHPQCRNCEAPLTGPFCHECGQKRIDDERPLLRVLGDWLAETFEADGRLARTLVPFFLQPGRLVRDYLAGRRARYMPPLRLYIFALLVSFFTLGVLVDLEQLHANSLGALQVDLGVPEPGAEPDGFIALAARRLEQRAERLYGMERRDAIRMLFTAFLDSAPTVLTLLVPVLALLLKLLYWRRYYVEHLLFSLVLHALALLLATVAGLLGAWTGSILPAQIALLAVAIHLVVSMHRVYGGPRWATALRILATVFFYPVALGVGVVASVLLALWNT